MAKQQPGKPQPGKPSPGKAAGGKAKAVKKPGGGTAGYVMGWLGRQVGHVKKAVKTDVQGKGGAAPKSGAAPKPARAAPVPEDDDSDDSGSTSRIIYREDKIEEAEMPDRPGVILRRTIIDEVVVETEEQQHPKTERPS